MKLNVKDYITFLLSFSNSCEEKRHLSIKLLPKKAGRTLRNNLDVLSEKLKDFIKQSMEPVNQSITDNSIDKEFQMKKKEVLIQIFIL